MPEVTFRPITQCTLDDPTDGAEPPSIVPDASNGAADAARGPNLTPPCQPAMPGAGGRGGDECTDALVRRFSGEGGAPAAEALPSALASSSSCLEEGLRALSMCSALVPVAVETRHAYTTTQILGCGAAAVALVECLTKHEPSVR